MKIKHSFLHPLLISLLIELFFNLVILLWIQDIISIVFLGSTQLFILADIVLFLIILFISWFFFFRIEYTFINNKVIVEKKHLFYSSTKTIFIKSDDLIIDERFNIFFNILQLENLKVYDTKLNKIISLVLKKYYADEIINLINELNIDQD